MLPVAKQYKLNAQVGLWYIPPPTDGAIIQWPSVEHPAYDFACRTGEPIYAVHSGVLMYDYNSRMGNQAVIHLMVSVLRIHTWKLWHQLAGTSRVSR